ncbi:hypothetical protein EST38_g11856 [Candolleomyces aberdarensis]|uniref:Uncharacterized protein n=1 Tax=Candolleomyces aberdarensis TaxID=2316362 RepID=A0A4Q2D3U4_9AGAR|nr:hypothetical protein EST38_g11856 [Candolleomyces aberdarensis]
MTSEESTVWSTVFFKVKGTIFQVPPHRFTEHSEDFANMFHMPRAGHAESVEGKDKEHPIVLDDYEAADFRALMKVLYPAPKDVISGAYTLTKEEWVGVLNLSTRWRMRQMREHAIGNLSKMSLTSFEKVTFARAHKVAKWLKEGLNEIVTQEETFEPDELKLHLGLETAFRLVWIQNQALKRPPAMSPSSNPQFTLGSLSCSKCHSAMFNSPQYCQHCGRTISVNAPEDISHIGKVGSLKVNSQNLRCGGCTRIPLQMQSYACPSCHSSTSYKNFRLMASTHQSPRPDAKVEDVFKEEIASYESWDQ